MIARLRAEPAVFIGLVVALLTLAVTFGLPLSADQVAGVSSFLVLVGAAVTRSRVTPVNQP